MKWYRAVLSLEQFQRFMDVIRKLGDRVEKEHQQFLRDSQRLEDRSANAVNGASGPTPFSGSVDFENLVGRSNGATVKADTVIDNSKGWDDDVWGSIFTSSEVCAGFFFFFLGGGAIFFCQLTSYSPRTQKCRLQPSLPHHRRPIPCLHPRGSLSTIHSARLPFPLHNHDPALTPTPQQRRLSAPMYFFRRRRSRGPHFLLQSRLSNPYNPICRALLRANHIGQTMRALKYRP